MSQALLIIGESGTGKSTSLRTLNPTTTFIINVLDKPLPFKGVNKRYSAVVRGKTPSESTGNYFASDNPAAILKTIDHVNDHRLDITTLIIDDFQYILANEFMRRATETGFNKFTEIGQNAWKILKQITNVRPSLTTCVLSHSDTDNTGKAKCKTIGRMLEEKIVIEGMFNIVLHALVIDGTYKFLTQHDGVHIAKSPLDMFQSKYIDNDLQYIKDTLIHYWDDDLPL